MRKIQRASATIVAALAVLGATAPAAADSGSLPGVPSGHRPGPDVLYAPRAAAPQLQNAGRWRARPILISGAEAYRKGEWLYQDFLHDDHGAAGAPDPSTPWGPEGFLFSPPAGTFTYPTDPVYAHNAADLVELRVKPLRRATAFRVTLNTLKDPERTGFTIALGSSEAAQQWPHGAGVSSPAEHFLTVHGSSAELIEAGGDESLSPEPRVRLSKRRRQVELRVAHAAWDPGQSKVRLTIGVGLWDPAADGYLAPTNGEASEATPGGAGPSGAAIVNVGPRFEEPFPDVSQYGAGVTIGDAAAGAAVQAAWWRERAQADALRLGDVTPFAAEVDFAKLAAGTRDNSEVPSTGPMNRILASSHEFGQGMDPERVCFEIGGVNEGADCVGRFVGQLQPYSIYVPDKPQPERGWGLTLLLHSLSANYNQYTASNNQSQLGDRGSGSLVVTPNARGPDGFYAGIAEADTFEVWADVARRYELDPRWVATSGYSMGGFGTFRLAARYPDLFGRAMATVGVPGSASDQLASLRNVPVMTWNATADELVNVAESEQMVADMTAAALRFVHWRFESSDHLTLATNDEYGPAADFLGTARARRSPAHVTYVVDPSEDSRRADAVADHAYWLSGLRVRDSEAGTGTIDVHSHAFGVGVREVQAVEQAAGTLEGGAHGPMPYSERSEAWGPTPRTEKADRLEIEATNVARAVVDVKRARLSCDAELDVATDGPLRVRLAGCGRAESFG
jgi:pimeloyl-ACP methyl ester carboxylesterase